MYDSGEPKKNHHNKQATTAKNHSTVRRTWSNKKEKKPSFYREGRQNKQQTDLLCDRQTNSKCLWFSHFKKKERELEEKKNMNTNKLFSVVQTSSSSSSAKNRINVVSLGANLSHFFYCQTEKRKIRVRSRKKWTMAPTTATVAASSAARRKSIDQKWSSSTVRQTPTKGDY